MLIATEDDLAASHQQERILQECLETQNEELELAHEEISALTTRAAAAEESLLAVKSQAKETEKAKHELRKMVKMMMGKVTAHEQYVGLVHAQSATKSDSHLGFDSMLAAQQQPSTPVASTSDVTAQTTSSDIVKTARVAELIAREHECDE